MNYRITYSIYTSVLFAVSIIFLLNGLIVSAHADDENKLRELTLAWVNGWTTSPENPYAIEQVQDLYVKDDDFISYDFGRPYDGVVGWEKFADYYPKFMEGMKTWKLTPNDDMRVFLRDDIAWTTVSLIGQGTTPDDQKIEMPEARVTLIFEKRGDKWLIVHEHGSTALPIPPDEVFKEIYYGNEKGETNDKE